MAEGKQWWATGFEETQRAREESRTVRGPQRIWQKKPKPGEFSEKTIVFLSDDPFGFSEHDYKANGKWGNFEVCLANIDGPCPMDLPKNDKLPINKSFASLFSTLDFSEWKDGQGKIHKYEKKILNAKETLLNKIKRQKISRVSLIGTEYKLIRDAGEKTANTGDDLEFVKVWDLKDLLAACKSHFEHEAAKREFIDKFNLDPFDFPGIIKPRPRDILKRIVEDLRKHGGGESGAPAGEDPPPHTDEDIPF